MPFRDSILGIQPLVQEIAYRIVFDPRGLKLQPADVSQVSDYEPAMTRQQLRTWSIPGGTTPQKCGRSGLRAMPR